MKHHFLYLPQASSAKLLHLGLESFQKAAVGQSRRHNCDLSWPLLDPQKYVCDRDIRNVSTLKKVSVVIHLISQRIQLSHKSLVTCLHYVFVMEIQLPALRWQNPACVTFLLQLCLN